MSDFRFLYEHKAREMESIALLSYELAKRGYSSDFYPCNGMGGIPISEAKVLITPYLYNDLHVDSMKKFARGADKIVNLQWEQIFQAKYEGVESFFHYPKGKAQTALHLCWGKKERDALIKCGISAENMVITGPVHMDFLRTEFKNYYLTKEKIAEEFGISNNKEWILFVSSFSGEARRLDSSGQPVDETDADRTKTIFLQWVQSVLEISKQSEFIYRPHPNEKSDARLTKLASKYKNFHIVGDYSVKQWIKVSEKIINWISTSIGEIFFAGKSCVIIRPLPIDPPNEMAILVGAKTINSLEGFISSLKSKSEFPVTQAQMLDYYDVKPEIASYKRICDVLISTLQDEVFSTDFNVKVEHSIVLKVKKAFARTKFYKPYIEWMSSLTNKSYFSKLPYKVRMLCENSKMRNRDYIRIEEIIELHDRFYSLNI